ncbi:hypothetical protein HPP92_012431 [Vanilla planifolia]|uniref:HSF-type DNA-binding domain-containing protein n=1 Tax=Vanilla planifolia TaxID=51239 RepID=A0A835UXJ1_VANPL|nr:hypothetical protein HPP92_012820 [Vanilla planifolia]KAG0477712.1 hypothetical protein HPP92_012431 [Vanilla planifolia]
MRGGIGFGGEMNVASAEGGGGEGGATPASAIGSAALSGNLPPPFLSKTYDMVDDPSTDAIVSWGPGNNSFVVWNVPEFSRDLLPKHFKHSNFSSFVRQLNTYGFRKVDPDKWEFANEGFLRGQKHLLKNINRRKSSQAHPQPPPPPPHAPTVGVGACVEVGKFGLDEEIERLKRDKNVLMQELVRLRQQQQGTDHQLQSLTQRLQGMERRQQQMMAFLATAMQRPGFLAQWVQQNDNRRIDGAGKKRRLPKEENDAEVDDGSSSQDGQIVKYQPLMAEAAKAMLMQILKLDSCKPEGLCWNSGVTLREVPTILQSPCGFPATPSSSEIPDVSLPCAVSESPQIHGMKHGHGSGNVTTNGLAQAEHERAFLDEASGLENGTIPIDIDNLSVDSDIDMLVGDDPRLPDINDSFWEQFLIESSISGDLDVESSNGQPEVNNVWESAQNMDHLTEQTGRLSPKTTK